MFPVSSLLLIALFPVPTSSCLATASTASPVIEPSTDPTITACSPTSITYSEANNEVPVASLAVTYSNYATDDESATMTVSCTASAGNIPTMTFNVNVFAQENLGAGQTVSATLTCSIAANTWIYSLVANGVTYTETVQSVECEQIVSGK